MLKAGCFFSSQSGRTFWFVKADFIDLHGTHSCLASLAITDKGRRVMRHFDGPFFGGNWSFRMAQSFRMEWLCHWRVHVSTISFLIVGGTEGYLEISGCSDLRLPLDFSWIFQRKGTIASCMGMWVQIPLRLKIILDDLIKIVLSYSLTNCRQQWPQIGGLGKPLSTGRLVAGGEFSFCRYSLIICFDN